MRADIFQKIECEVTFLSKSDDGWGRATMPVLNGNLYRPHLVVGDPNQRKPILTTRTHEVEAADGSKRIETSDKWIDEEYAGVSFDYAPSDVKIGETFKVSLVLMFWPLPVYERLQPGRTFTIREGGAIVGFGTVLNWLPPEPRALPA